MSNIPHSYSQAAGFRLEMVPEPFRHVPSYTLRLALGDVTIGTWEGFCPPDFRPHDAAQAWLDAWAFVTMEEGDTDSEVFADWTHAQYQFARHHGHAAMADAEAQYAYWAVHHDPAVRAVPHARPPAYLGLL